MNVVEVQNLTVTLPATGAEIVSDLTFSIQPGEILGVVGESGSGKTTAALALLGHVRRGAMISGGTVSVAGMDIRVLAGKALQALRGGVICYIPQDPSVALSPRMRIGQQLAETLLAHDPGLGKAAQRLRIEAALADVDLPATDAFLAKYPHQLSGGQKQRICIATAFALRPKVVVLDEPTTGLDVLTQDSVLATIRKLCNVHDVAALYVTHDLAVIANIAQRILVMKSGHIVEIGATADIFQRPRHAYTRVLVDATPDIGRRRAFDGLTGADGNRGPPAPQVTAALAGTQPVDCPPGPRQSQPLLQVDGVHARHGSLEVLHDVSIDVLAGECLALVGQSGSGKSTLSRVLVGLHRASAGSVRLEGEELERDAARRTLQQRRRLQYVFQSPFKSLNPRRTVGASIATPLQVFGREHPRSVDDKVLALLDLVSLHARVADLYPSDLSGGERQRAAIARAMASDPDVLICDEVTSALDVSVQASIIGLLQDLQRNRRVALLFVTHNLALVRCLADRIAVMHNGALIELGSTASVLDFPRMDYTKRLIETTPRVNTAWD